MQDRFKFRAKLKNMNEWIYGAYLKMLPYQPNPVGKRKPLEEEYKHLIIVEEGADWGMPRGISAYEVISETVGQCTGLKDKNGKLIYEGDIVRFAQYEIEDIEPDWEYTEVIWGGEDKYPAFDLKYQCFDSNGLSWIFNENYIIEVIGNIYENKELLEQ